MAQGRRGRPPGTSARALEVVALELFARQGFEDTTVDEIAELGGVSSRTFFRYFPTKADVLWHGFDAEVAELGAVLAAQPEHLALFDAIRAAVVDVNHYTSDDVPELRARMAVITASPALQATAAVRYDAWERVVSAFAADRLNEPVDSLRPLAIGRTTLAACRAAYELWVDRADADLTAYLDEAIRGLATGFGLRG